MPRSGRGGRAARTAAVRHGRDQQRDEIIFRKTQMCRFFAHGDCARGRDCSFAHCAEELLPLPDFRHTRLCAEFASKGRCRDGARCRFAHSEGQLKRAKLNSQGAHAQGRMGKRQLLLQELETAAHHMAQLTKQVQELASTVPLPYVAQESSFPSDFDQWCGAPLSMMLPLPSCGTQDYEGSNVDISGMTTECEFSDDCEFGEDCTWAASGSLPEDMWGDGFACTVASVPSSLAWDSELEEQDVAEVKGFDGVEVHVKNTFLHFARFGTRQPAARRASSAPPC